MGRPFGFKRSIMKHSSQVAAHTLPLKSTDMSDHSRVECTTGSSRYLRACHIAEQMLRPQAKQSCHNNQAISQYRRKCSQNKQVPDQVTSANLRGTGTTLRAHQRGRTFLAYALSIIQELNALSQFAAVSKPSAVFMLTDATVANTSR